MSINSMTNAAAARRMDMGVAGKTPTDLQQIAQAARTMPLAVTTGPVTPTQIIGSRGGLPANPVAPAGTPMAMTARTSPSVGSIETAYNTLFGYIPTEIVTVYVAVVAALSTPTLPSTHELDVQKQWALLIFCIVTPLVVWIIYASKLRGAGKPLPLSYGTWPVWEMMAAELAFCAWAYALPGNPLESLHAVPTGINGLLVLITSTVLGLLSPLFQRPLQ